MRGWLLAGILMIILLIAGLSYWRVQTITRNSKPAYDALPASTSLFFEFKDFAATTKSLHAGAFNNDLGKTGFMVKLKNETEALDSILGATTYTFSGNKAIASVYFTELGQFDYLYLIEQKNVLARDIKIAMRAIDDTKKGKLKVRDFKGEPVYEITRPGVAKPVTFAFMKGVLICSFSSFLVEESILQIKERPSIASEKSFKELQRANVNNADATMFVRFGKLDQLESLLVNADVDSLFPFLKNFSGWMAADLSLKSDFITINGYSLTGDSSNVYLSQFNQKPVRDMGVAQVLPANTAVYIYRTWQEPAQGNDPAEYKYLRPWPAAEIAYGISEPFDHDFQQEYFLAVAVNDDEKAMSNLVDLSKLSTDSIGMVDFSGFKIGHLHVGKAISNFFDPKLFTLTDPYFTVLKSHVIFANSDNTLKNMISRYVNGEILGKSAAYKSFTKNLSDKSNLMVYVDPSRSVEILKALLAPALLETIATGDQSFRKFSPIALQFTNNDNDFVITGSINYQHKTEDELTNQVWRTRLDTVALTAPCFITNPQGDPQLLVQDGRYNLYLVNKAGKVIWKKNVAAPIKGSFAAIDLYKDGQQQFVFNTTAEIYIVDQKGNNVESFPIRLPAPATSGILVVDPNNTRDYKMFVACNNYSIYGYEASGKPLTGWSPQAKVGTITDPLQYVSYSGAERIIATNNSGTLIYFGLDGKRPYEPIRLDKKFSNPFSLYKADSSFTLVNADQNGLVHVLDINAAQTTLSPDSGRKQYFLFVENTAADGYYIFVDSNAVRVYDKQQLIVNTYTPAFKIDQPAFAVDIPGLGKGAGLVAADAGKIYLLSPQMTLMDGFPLDGSTAFSIALLNNNGEKILVTADKSGYLDAYRLK